MIRLPDAIAKVFIIHLERATTRRKQVERLMAMFDRPVEIFPAVDANQLSEKQMKAFYKPDIHRPRYPFVLSKTEIACFMSHRAVWSQIVRSGFGAALILEDDVALDASIFANAVSRTTGSGTARAFVRLPEMKDGVPKGAVHSKRTQPALPGLGMQAQVVTFEAAQALLAFTQTFDRPVDTTIQMRWLHKVPVLEIMPSGVTEIDGVLGGTTIQKKDKGLVEIVQREVHRARYRLAIKRLAGRYVAQPANRRNAKDLA